MTVIAKPNKRPKWQKMGAWGYIALVLTTLLSIFPFYWMFIVASNGTAGCLAAWEFIRPPSQIALGDLSLQQHLQMMLTE